MNNKVLHPRALEPVTLLMIVLTSVVGGNYWDTANYDFRDFCQYINRRGNICDDSWKNTDWQANCL